MISWLAELRNGVVIPQFDCNGQAQSSDNIDRSQIKTFSLFDDDRRVLSIHLDHDDKLIYRRRVEQKETGETQAVYIVGCSNKGYYSFLFEDGRVEIINSFVETDPWFYSPTFREFEL